MFGVKMCFATLVATPVLGLQNKDSTAWGACETFDVFVSRYLCEYARKRLKFESSIKLFPFMTTS